MPIDIRQLKPDQLIKIRENRWKDSESVWSVIERVYKGNMKVWSGRPDWLATIPTKRSKARDNVIFRAMESRINKLTARPVKPMVAPANKTEEARTIATNLQDYLLAKYRDLNIKRTLKRALRFLHLSRLGMVKIYWNQEIDDFDVKACDPRKVRVSKKATCARESDFAIEKIDDKTVMDLIAQFPEKQDIILSKAGITLEQAIADSTPAEWFEMWIGNGVCWIYKNEVLHTMLHPYFDFSGLLLSAEEKAQLEQRNAENLPMVNGRRRRQMFQKFKEAQGDRREEISKDPNAAGQYEAYLYNHHDKPRIPYIFGTVLEVEDSPIGETSHIELAEPLQDNADKHKRQIADNGDFVNGITKVDTDVTELSLADARRAHNDPDGLLYGAGVSAGVVRETGEPLPDSIFKNMQDSRLEVDALMGTNATFRGDERGSETATGRAILREEGMSLLDEPGAFVDYMGQEIYDYMYQMIRVRYTESHLVKGLGKDRADETIELMQDDLQDGIELKIIPGQTLPEDKMYKAERAREDAEAGLIDIETYLEQAGGYDNPKETAKRAIMYKLNPLSVVTLGEEDVKKLESAAQLMQFMQPQKPGAEGAPAEQNGDGEKQMRKKIQELVASKEFQTLPRAEKARVIREIRGSLEGKKVEVTNQ